MSWPTDVYRIYDRDDQLLYIGSSMGPKYRIRDHARTAPWRHEIARWSVESFPTREAALIAEADAIRAEQPRWNIAHKTPRADGTLRPDEIAVQRLRSLVRGEADGIGEVSSLTIVGAGHPPAP